MGFDQKDVDKLLAKCHRRCCICHRFCGVKMETDHMKQQAEKGTDKIANAIPLCFECHAEVHSYNDKHPRGRKFHENELKEHKKQWLKICEEHPESLVDTPRIADPGPMSSLLTELEYNERINLESKTYAELTYETKQFDRAVSEGILSLVNDELRIIIMDAYALMKRSNGYARNISNQVKSNFHLAAKDIASHAHKDVHENLLGSVEKLRELLKTK